METATTQWTSAIWHAAMAQSIDRISISDYGVSAATLMAKAGKAVARAAYEWGAAKHPVLVLAGRGNNGADGLVAAWELHDQGADVQVIVAPGAGGTELFLQHLDTVTKRGIPIEVWSSGCLRSNEAKRRRPVVIDALTGLGCRLPLREPLPSILTEASELEKTSVIAVDIPSGIDADYADARPILPATVTVTFGAAKPCHVLMPAAVHCGVIQIEDIGFSPAAIEDCGMTSWLRETNPEAVIRINPWQMLRRDANKYDRGHVLIIGGSEGKIGAAVLAGMSALRGGAGWVTLAVPNGRIPVDRPVPWELTLENVFDGSSIAADQLQTFISERKVNSIVLGPGWMDQKIDSKSWTVLAEAANRGIGLVLDAGALHRSLDLIDGLTAGARVILTPHPGEWKKLYATSILPVPDQATSVRAVQSACASKHATLVFKGASPVVCTGHDAIVCTSGSNILARAGTGDVLCGVIAAHLAIGANATFSFARSYAMLSQAALRAAAKCGHDGVIASDLIDEIGLAGRI